MVYSVITGSSSQLPDKSNITDGTKSDRKKLVFWGLFTPPIHRRDVVSRQLRNEADANKEEEFDSMSGPRTVTSRINEIKSGQPTS